MNNTREKAPLSSQRPISQNTPSSSVAPIAIVGMGGVFPGAANISQFWENIQQAKSAATLVPEHRWVMPPEIAYQEKHQPDRTYSQTACLVDEEISLDVAGLHLEPSLLQALDPLYLMTLHAGKEAYDNAQMESVAHERTGVILAAIALPTDGSSALTRATLGEAFAQSLNKDLSYVWPSETSPPSASESLNGRVTALPAMLLAQALQLGGRAFTLDAACASSLYAIKLACDELREGRADAMLAGGVSRPENLYTQIGFSQLKALSPSGRCAPFDKDADGLVVGEGAGIFMLKRLDDAVRDKDHVLGVIRGIGLSNDIGGGLLAPDSEGQLRAMKLAYHQAEWAPNTVDLIECHGTGTPLGDKTEFDSLCKLWESDESRESSKIWQPQQCVIGSIKSMIGHLLTGASAASLVKVLLAFQHKELPPSANFAKPAFPMEQTPFQVVSKPRPWPKHPNVPARRAAVSAFGFGGINAHLLVEEWDTDTVTTDFSEQSDNNRHRNDDRHILVKEQDADTATPEVSRQSSNDRHLLVEKQDANTATAHIRTIYLRDEGREPVALVGMDVHVGKAETLEAWAQAVLQGQSLHDARPKHRWSGGESWLSQSIPDLPEQGSYLSSLDVPIGTFRLPPNEIAQLLPQQLLMLQVAAKAMRDAGLPLRDRRPRMGTFIGVGFDFECTRFHLRWALTRLAPQWAEQLALQLTPAQLASWVMELQDALGPALNATRTVGALGGIVASRIAKEFLLGGPSFILSSEEVSGLQALELATRALQRHELDAALVGAVDITGDISHMATMHALKRWTPNTKDRSFSQDSQGRHIGEGATAFVLKRLSDATREKDRIYAVIKGIGIATGGDLDTPDATTLRRAISQAHEEADIAPTSLSYLETQGSGIVAEDTTELQIWEQLRSGSPTKPLALSTLAPVTGHLGAASSLTAVAKASLALYHKRLPGNPEIPSLSVASNPDFFHIPQSSQPWLRNRIEGPRAAAVQSLALGGSAAHCVLQEVPSTWEEVPSNWEEAPSSHQPLCIASINDSHALFVLEGESPTDLLVQAEALQRQLREGLRSLPQEASFRLQQNPLQPERNYCISLVSQNHKQALEQLHTICESLSQGDILRSQGKQGIFSTPSPLGPEGRLAFIYPGSGNHYIEMGRQLGLRFPEVLAQMDAETDRLQDQMLPPIYMPWRHDWSPGWRTEAAKLAASHAHHMIFGQVFHGGFVTEVCRRLGLNEEAIIGYSLGESAGLFASKAWPERGQMLERMEASPLFQNQLAGPCDMARQVWQVPQQEDVAWRTAVLQRSAEEVRQHLKAHSTARLLIINTPDECVIGGRQKDVEAVIRELQSEAIYLQGIVTVHCEAVEPVKDAYRALHLFPTTATEGIDYYSGYLGRSYPLTRESAADSILNQALYGFDYTRTIRQAYDDGIRLFVEMGPRNSCTRMIKKILKDLPHFAQSACVSGEQDIFSIQNLMAGLLAERIPVNLHALYPKEAKKSTDVEWTSTPKPSITVPVGQPFKAPTLPKRATKEATSATQNTEKKHRFVHIPMEEKTISDRNSQEIRTQTSDLGTQETMPNKPKPTPQELIQPTLQSNPLQPQMIAPVYSPSAESIPRSEVTQISTLASPPMQLTADVLPGLSATWEARGQAHDTYLRMSQQNQQAMMETLALQQQLLETALTKDASFTPAQRERTKELLTSHVPEKAASHPEHQTQNLEPTPPPQERKNVELRTQTPELRTQAPEREAPRFTREQCMEFAIGSIAKVLGPEFSVIDSYPVRVRLPDEPLMLVDRILSVTAEKAVLGRGSLITEHDVNPGAWYLDADRMPVCVTVEAGQADLFLCSYMGIDFKLKGKRAYRLLDAEIHFHRELPKPGETIQYDITIEKFVRQGEIYLFFFRFDGTIHGQPLITMRNGCAGFFTDEEIDGSGGIVRPPAEWEPRQGKVDTSWKPLVPFEHTESYDESEVKALRRGDYAACFGPVFKNLSLQHPTYLPSGKMKLFDRVLEVNPTGGRYSLGLVRSEADIHPDDWFLTCHFMDDMVMPGTLMYECCAHTLRVLLMRMGWVGEHSTTHFEPIPGITAKLACRAPVRPSSQKVVYEVEIKEIGTQPYPYVIADALMYVDGKCSVSFDNMSMQMTGQSFAALQQLWKDVDFSRGYNRLTHESKVSPFSGKPILYDIEQIMAYAVGKPSEGFGPQYAIFDQDRVLARLPGPPYLFLDRVVEIEPEPWTLKAGGWIEIEYDIPEDAWYFAANHQPVMPFAILLEIALQPCGWLAAYLGSALQNKKDLAFRNLGGEGILTALTRPTSGTLTVRVQMYDVSKAGGMLIERFHLKVLQQGNLIYDGTTYFGFFTKAALATQVGILDAQDRLYEPTPKELAAPTFHTFKNTAPLLPEDGPIPGWSGASIPGKALRMVDRIDIFLPNGGPQKLGFLRGSKDVDPEEWFFAAHFYQDPVCPGSLGLESFLQLLRFYMIRRWGKTHGKDHMFEPILLNEAHRWEYRGQILPTATKVEVDAVITKVEDGPHPMVKASGFLKVDGLLIYEMIDFGLRMIPHSEEA